MNSTVVDTFIISYYKLLFSDRNNIGNFYAENAELTRIYGISKSSLRYNKQLSFESLLLFHPETTIAKIFNYNFVTIPDTGELIITVNGEVDQKSKVSNFSQTFVLAEIASKYFIVSDLLTTYEFDDSNLVGAELEQQSNTKSDFTNRFNQNRNAPKEKVLQANSRIKPFFKP